MTGGIRMPAPTPRDKSELTYTVVCHVCEYPAGDHPRNTSTAHGTPAWGALWHCPEHADVKCGCPHGEWCDKECAIAWEWVAVDAFGQKVGVSEAVIHSGWRLRTRPNETEQTR